MLPNLQIRMQFSRLSFTKSRLRNFPNLMMNSQRIWANTKQLLISRRVSKKICSRDLSEYFEGHEKDYYLEYYIKEGLGVASKGTMIFTSPKCFSYLDPHIKAEVVGRDKRYSVTLTADAYAGAVELSFAEHSAVFFENYFDLTQNSPYKISFTLTDGEDSAYALARSLKITSLYDIG